VARTLVRLELSYLAIADVDVWPDPTLAVGVPFEKLEALGDLADSLATELVF
jgi:hypothetical protein